MKMKAVLLGAAAVAAMPTVSFTAFAQEDDAPEADRTLGTIIVEARKREESIQDVPVVVQAFDAELLEIYKTTEFGDLNNLVSGLTIHADGPVQPSINVRGIQGNAINSTGDDAVAVNLDGVQHSSAQLFRFGLFDVEAIEVLKGPQALFFGKNSPGGVVSIRTKDPTDEFYSEFQAGYEFSGERTYGHGIISGPLSDNWGARVGVRLAEQKGYFDNIWGDGDPTAQQPNNDLGPDFEEFMFTGTLKGEFDRGDITLKALRAQREGDIYAQTQVIFDNGTGFNPYTDGKLDDTRAMAPFFDTTGSIYGGDQEFFEYELTQISLDANLELNDNWSVHSITGLVDVDNSQFGLGNAGPAALTAGIRNELESLSQEIRLDGQFDRFNVMVGGFVDDREFTTGAAVWLAPFLRLTPDTTSVVEGNSWSLFAQADYDLTEQIEVSVGGRYTDETRETGGEVVEANGFFFTGAGPLPVPQGPYPLAVDEVSYSNFSPEVTVSYRPTDDLTFFANYKEGFKSGGFNSSSISRALAGAIGVPLDDSFLEENVEGYELGAKMELFNNTMRLNVTAFSYDYTDLQQSAFFTTPGGGIEVRTVNAGSAFIDGVEADMLWLTPVEGLTFTGNLAYNDNEFGDYNSECNDYQLFVDATGCDVDLDNNVATSADGSNPNTLVAGTGFDAQNRAGQPLRRAPEWAGSLGLNYERNLSNDLIFRSNGAISYSGEYQANGENNPRGIQESYAIFDASFGIGSQDGGWQLDLIGRNLTDEAYITTAYDATGSAGTDASGDRITEDNLQAARNAPMQVFLQLTIRPQVLFGN